MRKRYQFGYTQVEVLLPEEMKIPENMKHFEIEAEALRKETPAKVCELEFTEDLFLVEKEFRQKYPEAKEILRRNMRILTAPGKECRVIYIEGAPVPYAVSVEESEVYTHTWVLQEAAGMLEIAPMFVALLGLEKVMLQSNALILHSAYMYLDGTAVLFSAPSGTGKSTQADLWEKYRGTRTVNGDRSLLLREAEGWYAHGWPICGTSEICHNESYPIRAIVMLRQAKENAVRRLRAAEAMKKVFAQITINMWNTEFQLKAMDLIQALITEVPVYELECDISEDAVACLERVL